MEEEPASKPSSTPNFNIEPMVVVQERKEKGRRPGPASSRPHVQMHSAWEAVFSKVVAR